MAKELAPVVVAATIWGPNWQGHKVLFLSLFDNVAAVAAICLGTAKDPSIRHLLRCLFFFAAAWQFDYTAAHIPGVANTAADALSCDRANMLHTIFPAATHLPSSIPISLQELILNTDACWTSQPWRQSFNHFMGTVSPTIRPENMTQYLVGSSGSVTVKACPPSH